MSWMLGGGWHDGTHVCGGKHADEQIVDSMNSMLGNLASMPASWLMVLLDSSQDGHVIGGDTVNDRQHGKEGDITMASLHPMR